MNIAILGGSFNPPHFAHQLIASQVLELAKQDQVWLVPCFAHPFVKKLTPAPHRLKMTRFLASKNILVSDIEIKQQKINYTIDTLNLLKSQYPKHRFSLIIGSDIVLQLPKWKNYQKLLKENNFIIFPRTNLPSPSPKIPNAKYLILNTPYLVTTNISSFLIRRRIKNNLSIKYLVPARVEEYIKKHKLYNS